MADGAARNRLPFLRSARAHRGDPARCMPSATFRNRNIWKFEEVGTHSAAAVAAIPEALAFHRAIGGERKAARLRYLTLRWADVLKTEPWVMLSSLEAGDRHLESRRWRSTASTAQPLAQHLFDRYRIVVASEVDQKHPGPGLRTPGLRITPSVYTPLEEVDTFVSAIRDVLKQTARRGLRVYQPTRADTWKHARGSRAAERIWPKVASPNATFGPSRSAVLKTLISSARTDSAARAILPRDFLNRDVPVLPGRRSSPAVGARSVAQR